ncbi:hypothetical protein, partial [Alicyclobacillus sendaiensis]|uniref:hypothetical protein n=1 Tax=Alicyclobacillus sendaiensis TaxID=192387 RepID=UPI0026F47850
QFRGAYAQIRVVSLHFLLLAKQEWPDAKFSLRSAECGLRLCPHSSADFLNFRVKSFFVLDS